MNKPYDGGWDEGRLEVGQDIPTNSRVGTGEQGADQEEQATTIVSKYLPVITPCRYTPSDIAERIIRTSIQEGRRENMNEQGLRDKTAQVANNLTQLVHGRWDQNKCLKALSSPSGTFLISANGDYELDNHALAFVELPEGSVTARLVGRYAVLRFMPERENYAGRNWQFPTKESKGRTYLDSYAMPTALLEGIVCGFDDLERAQVALDELQQAIRTLATARYHREQAEMSDSERAIAQYEADERRLEALARQPKQEPAI